MATTQDNNVSTRSVLKHVLAVMIALGIISLSVHASDALFIALLAPWVLILLFILLVIVVKMDMNDHRAAGSIRAFSGSAVVLGGIICGTAILVSARSDANIPILIRAGQFQDFNGSSLELRTDGTYRYCDIVFNESCCKGRYALKGDTISLSSKNGCREGILVIGACDAEPSRTCLRWTNDQLPEMWMQEDHR